MTKVLDWVLSKTKIGKVIGKVQDALKGKKAYIAGGALAIPALLTIVQNFSDQGTGYLIGLTTTPEYTLLLEGLAVMGLRAAITKKA